MRRIVLPALFALALLPVACKKEPVAEGYRVTAYDAATKQWTIIRNGNFSGRYLTKKLIVVCTFYQWGKHEMVKGPDACHLQVGRLIIPKSSTGGWTRE